MPSVLLYFMLMMFYVLHSMDYFVLETALKKGYKISLEVFEKPGDELTFLKRRRMLLSERELAIQNHPKTCGKVLWDDENQQRPETQASASPPAVG